MARGRPVSVIIPPCSPDAGFPLVEEISPPPDPETAFRKLADKRHCLFLDSAQRDPQLGRYSFLSADPVELLVASDNDPFARLCDYLGAAETVPGLPPFQGGLAGLFSYDLALRREAIPRPVFNEFPLPEMILGLYDVVLAYDHLSESAWLISQGLGPPNGEDRRARAARRIRQFRDWLAAPLNSLRQIAPSKPRAAELAPQYATSGSAELKSNFSADQYRAAVERAVEYIYAGDVFQVNLSQRLIHPARDHAVELYCRLRKRNPAPFAGYFDLGDRQIVSASPERFLRVRDRKVEARPIKGTRQRTKLPEADLFAGSELMLSEKDRAENIMIVDLMRNDLSQVCDADTVQVTQLCDLEVYGYVQHLVSAVTGHLDDAYSAADLVRAAFPAGSITGAPKIRAMQIISELEPTSRGAYCGSLGYLGADGTLDLNVLIRTITAADGWWQLPAGGGIVAQSNPSHEYEETWHKAAGMLRSLE